MIYQPISRGVSLAFLRKMRQQCCYTSRQDHDVSHIALFHTSDMSAGIAGKHD